jgi:hypothetical protein
MRRIRFKTQVCSLLAVALLLATSQYLAHFHIAEKGQAHSAQEHCSLCIQFDRLPAPPSPRVEPAAYFYLVATVEAERLERLALATPQLWPPSRGPPSLDVI